MQNIRNGKEESNDSSNSVFNIKHEDGFQI
jgi:hypothetical protein